MIFPLRFKLLVLTIGLLAASIVTISMVMLEQSREALETEARKRASALALNLARNARDPVLLEDDLVVGQLLETAAKEAEVLVARLLDKDGNLLHSSSTHEQPQRERLTVQTPQASQLFGGRLVVAARLAFRDVDLGEAQIVLDLEGLIAPVFARARREVLLASGGLLIVAVIIAVAMSGFTTRPLRRLRVAVNALASGDLSARVLPTTRDEIGELTRAFNEMSESLSQKRRIESAFRRYVSDHVLRQVSDSKESIKLHGERREITVLFIDIRQFTRMASWVGPERVVAFLNEAFELITSHLLDHGATVDKYIGDAILTYFGAPIESPDHAERAVAAAIAVQRAVEERNRTMENQQEHFTRLNVGIGIQTGPVVVGNIGSQFKMDYTAIGDAVNVANRMQDLAGPGEILITADVAKRVGHLVESESLGMRQLDGRDAPVEAFRVTY